MSQISLNHSEKNSLTVDSQSGATLTSLVLGGTELIKYPLKKEDRAKGYPSAFLFPFPNRVKDGTYTFEGKSYHLDINEKELSNAIHGLLAFEPFKVLENNEKNTLTLEYEYEAKYEGYPFPYRFSVSYKLEESKLTILINVENTGSTTMPCGFGWHPYFGFNGELIGNMKVKAPWRNKILLSDRNIPTGEKESQKAEIISLKNTFLDDLFEFQNPKSTEEIELIWQDKKLILSQNTGKDQLNHFILYTPPSRDCIAIEPQSASTNAFNNGDGLIKLKAGNSCKFQFGVRIEN